MTDDQQYHTVEETARLRAEHPLPAPCSGCGVEAEYLDDIIPHIMHAEGCPVAANIRETMAK